MMRFKRKKIGKVLDSVTKAVVKEIDPVKNAQKVEDEVKTEDVAEFTPSKKLSKKSQRIVDAALKIKALFGLRNNPKNLVDPRTKPLIPKGSQQENGVVEAAGNERASIDGSVNGEYVGEHVGNGQPFELLDPFGPARGPLNSNPVTPSDIQAFQRGHQRSGAVTNLEPEKAEATNGFGTKDFMVAGQ